jgi:hypothetical protein
VLDEGLAGGSAEGIKDGSHVKGLDGMKEGSSRQQTAARTNGAPEGLGDGSLGGMFHL